MLSARFDDDEDDGGGGDNAAIVLMSRVFANDPRDRGSVLGRVIPKTQKMVLDAAAL